MSAASLPSTPPHPPAPPPTPPTPTAPAPTPPSSTSPSSTPLSATPPADTPPPPIPLSSLATGPTTSPAPIPLSSIPTTPPTPPEPTPLLDLISPPANPAATLPLPGWPGCPPVFPPPPRTDHPRTARHHPDDRGSAEYAASRDDTTATPTAAADPSAAADAPGDAPTDVPGAVPVDVPDGVPVTVLIEQIAADAAALAVAAIPDDPEQCLEQTQQLMSARDRISVAIAARVGVVHARGQAKTAGHASTRTWLRAAGRMAPRTAGRLLELAVQLGRLPTVFQLFTTGALSEGAASAICAAVSDLDEEQARQVEPILIRLAQEATPAEVARVGRYLHELVAPGTTEKTVRDLDADRYLQVSETPEGGMVGRFLLSREAAALFRAWLDAYARPRAENDDRSLRQRYADAFESLLTGRVVTELLVLVRAESLPDDPPTTADQPAPASPASSASPGPPAPPTLLHPLILVSLLGRGRTAPRGPRPPPSTCPSPRHPSPPASPAPHASPTPRLRPKPSAKLSPRLPSHPASPRLSLRRA